jgi:hypothetical protein
VLFSGYSSKPLVLIGLLRLKMGLWRLFWWSAHKLACSAQVGGAVDLCVSYIFPGIFKLACAWILFAVCLFVFIGGFSTNDFI